MEEGVGTLDLPTLSRPRIPAPRVYETLNSLEHLIVLTPTFPGAFDTLSLTGSLEHLALPWVLWGPLRQPGSSTLLH